jgi:hypothetical protein
MIRTLGALTAGLLAASVAGCATDSGPGVGAPALAAAPAATAPSAAERDPDRLRELDPQAVTGLIGAPNYVRHEGGAVVWQYVVGSCVMDLFWYPSTGEALHLEHYEVRGARITGVAEASSCFGNLLVRRRDAALS